MIKVLKLVCLKGTVWLKNNRRGSAHEGWRRSKVKARNKRFAIEFQRGSCECGNEPLGFIKYGEFLD
jgi:hypothetical protein